MKKRVSYDFSLRGLKCQIRGNLAVFRKKMFIERDTQYTYIHYQVGRVSHNPTRMKFHPWGETLALMSIFLICTTAFPLHGWNYTTPLDYRSPYSRDWRWREQVLRQEITVGDTNSLLYYWFDGIGWQIINYGDVFWVFSFHFDLFQLSNHQSPCTQSNSFISK